MTWPTQPMPAQATAILLLPSGHRAHDGPCFVDYPPPRVIDGGPDGEPGRYHLFHLHQAGSVDGDTRALYVLGGTYRPHGAQRNDRHDPDEAHDQ